MSMGIDIFGKNWVLLAFFVTSSVGERRREYSSKGFYPLSTKPFTSDSSSRSFEMKMVGFRVRFACFHTSPLLELRHMDYMICSNDF